MAAANLYDYTTNPQAIDPSSAIYQPLPANTIPSPPIYYSPRFANNPGAAFSVNGAYPVPFVPSPNYNPTAGGTMTAPSTLMAPNQLFPGTPNVPNAFTVSSPEQFGIKNNAWPSPLDAAAYEAMIYRQSGGRSGKPMPPTYGMNLSFDPNSIPTANPRFAANQDRAFALWQQDNPNFNTPFSSDRTLGTGNTGYNYPGVPNPVVARAVGGSSYTANAGYPSGSGQWYGGQFYPQDPLARYVGQTTKRIQPGLTTVTKNPGQQNLINTDVAQFNSGPLGQAKSNSLTQYTQDFLDQRAKQRGNLGQESSFINSTYDPNGLEAQLAGMATNRAAIGRQVVQAALQRASREANLARMSQGGVNSSYLDRAYNDQATNLLLNNANNNANIQQGNLQYLQGQRTGLLGTRAALSNNFTNNALAPYQNLSAAQAQDLENIGRVGNLQDNNTLYNYVTPGQAAGQNLGLLGDLTQQRRIYGV